MGELLMTRRAFAKVMAVTAAAAGFTGAQSALADTEPAASSGEVKRIRSACRGCGKMECGVWVTVQDGRVVKTEGDESAFQSAGNHCAKGQASLQAAYHPDRLMYPLKRTNPKGQEPGWVRISWDEAYRSTVEAIHKNQEKYGNETCFFMGGTSRIWAMGQRDMQRPALLRYEAERFERLQLDGSGGASARVRAMGRRVGAVQLRR